MAPRANFNLETLRDAIPNIFDQVQSSTATHKKNCVTLFKLHGAAAAIVDTTQQGKKQAELKLTGEKEFTDTVMDMINRVLVVKKGVPSADRITKFVGSYAKFLNDKGIPSVANSEDETVISRFITRLLKHLMKGFTAKNKNVRFRVVSLTAEIVSYLGELDEDLYKTLRSGLLDRLQDKESLVRTHAVVTLCKLAMSDDPEDLDEDEQPILVCLLDSLCCDPAPEARRASLIHIPLVPQILPALLTRTRDVDPVTRKLVYTSLLPRLDHPKQLTITQREFIVCHGLGDREEAVRVAAAKVLKGWLDLYEGDIVEFLSIFDALNGEVAVDAVKSIFVSAPEVLDDIEFDDAFWTNLKPETAMLARVFVEHCFSKKDEARLESSLPVVTALAFHVQSKYNSLLELLQEADEAGVLETEDDEESEARDEQIANIEFVIGELLKLAVHLDFGDEIGRRKMFTITREMIAHAALPDSLIKPCLGVLEVLSANERDLIRLVVEVVNELRDTEDADPEGNDNQTAEGSQAESPTRRQKAHTKDLDNMTPAERIQADVVNLRCLNLCIGVLEKVNGSFDENSTLEGILADLVIPSVKRKELVLREKGLVCLGLCCLIARNMALNSFQLFLSQIKSAPEGLKIQVLRVVFDVLMTYEKDFLGRPDEIGDRVIGFLMQVLETEESHAVQALLCLGLSKLMLFGLVTDNRVLTGLVLAYVSPVTADNHQLRQCLAYFLPAYCYSSSTNQKRMQSVFTTAFDLVNQVYESLEDDQSMVTPLHFGQLFVDWTNPENLAHLPGGSDQDSDVHVALAVDILQGLYESDCPRKSRSTPYIFAGY
ncbi:hypothetical protein BD410DRAFT_722164 [Rickenella mellea]|uniref:Nuclear condensin complex subunit 3 C-terminal domain-containing protein n=1 Tax=Rickenella mellea TaxID=50990 RepID=A0A4Y7Q6L5_9AGAM|nr:hypothetical protein BD410DRAFT_722164 [Rickenella mellea]